MVFQERGRHHQDHQANAIQNHLMEWIRWNHMDQWRDQLFIWIESVMMMTHIILIGIGFISSAHLDFKEVANVAAPYFEFENFHYFQCAIFFVFRERWSLTTPLSLVTKNKPSEDVRHMIMVPMVIPLVPNQWTRHIIPDHLIVSLRQHRRTNQWTRQWGKSSVEKRDSSVCSDRQNQTEPV